MVLNTELTQPKSNNVPVSVTILGSTGSVGVNTIDLIARNPEYYSVEALTANKNFDLLAKQAKQVNAKFVAVADESKYLDLKNALSGSGIEIAAGKQSVANAAMRPSDRVMAAIVGTAGLIPTLRAVERGAIIGLANKECLVSAGQLFCEEVRKAGAELLPVDSEHSAIFQVLDLNTADKVARVIITASGGPFRTASYSDMRRVSPAQAVAHPNWDMGAKISIDSATMMNKGLELIEAFHLFPITEEQLEVVVHPQSIIHSLVEYTDGSVLAQLGTPDMRTPISYALAWPDRMVVQAEKLDLCKIATLTFEEPDLKRFPALKLAREALIRGGTAPTILNAANEIAVAAFLEERIGFLEIASLVEQTLNKVPHSNISSIDDVTEADALGRRLTNAILP